jgi:hypothetical protein
VWPIFAQLRRTLLGGRTSPPPPAGAPSFEADWAGLLARLGLPPHVLRAVVASGSLEPHFQYRRYHKPKRDGGRREIAEPGPELKQLQYAIISRYFATEQPHPAAVAYRPGKSTADHVWAHAGAAVFVVADVQDFFPNTRADRIEGWWRERADDDTARLLTLLTTDRGGLPQGAPTSPALSNFVNRELDTVLAQRAALTGARYTRYCDDLCFSWPAGSGPPGGFEPGVRGALHEFGYSLHPTKGWRVYDRRDEPTVTGVVLTRAGGVRLPDHLRRLMRELARSGDPGAAARLDGYEGYAAMVTRDPNRRRAKKTKEKAPRAARPPRAPLPPRPPRAASESDPDEGIPF